MQQSERRVLTAKEMAHVERLSLTEGAASAESYMDAAAVGMYETLLTRLNPEEKVTILVGKGHNGADALTLAALLYKQGFQLKVFPITPFENCVALCQKKWRAFEALGGQISSLESLQFEGAIIDGLLGTGFEGSLCSPFLEVIKHANQSKLPIYSIDIPSGLNGTTGEPAPIAIYATETLSLGTYKTGFFLREGFNHVGKLTAISFGLEERYLDKADPMAYLVDESKMHDLLPPIKRKRHKYERGALLILAGSQGMAGAALLAAKAAYRSGAGIVKLYQTQESLPQSSSVPLELVRLTDWELFLEEMWRSKALLIGPGMGRSESDRKRFETLFDRTTLPTVIDADGLFHLKTRSFEAQVPMILTPHRKEMLRLLGEEEMEDEALIESTLKYAREHHVTLILKGAPTWIFHPGLKPMLALRGDPAMATAGTGDVLAGILGALLAQGLTPLNAALLGTYLHGTAGEHAAKRLTSHCVIASDLIGYLPIVFHSI